MKKIDCFNSTEYEWVSDKLAYNMAIVLLGGFDMITNRTWERPFVRAFCKL